MKISFYIIGVLLIAASSFFLLENKLEEMHKLAFVEAKKNVVARDSLQLFQLIEEEWKVFVFPFMEHQPIKEAYFVKDTINIRLSAGFLHGYTLFIKIIGEEYKIRLIDYGCTRSEELKIQQQRLVLEDFNLEDGEKLKAEIYCETKRNEKDDRVKKVKIMGYFEMDLVDVVKLTKLY